MDQTAEQKIKDVLTQHKIDIFHETATNQSNEVIFTVLPRQLFEADSQQLLNDYVAQNTLANSELSPNSVQYLAQQKDQYVLILGQVNKSALFEKQDLQFIKDNAANYVAKKILGEPVNYTQDFEAMFNKLTFQAGVVVVGATELAQDAFQKTLQTIQSTNAKEIFNAGTEKMGSLFGGFKNKLKQKIEESQNNASSSSKPKP